MLLDFCTDGMHGFCVGKEMTDDQAIHLCSCPCHKETPQAELIVRSLRRAGVRPATIADLTRFQERIANGTVGR